MKPLFCVLLLRRFVSPLLGMCSVSTMKCVKIRFLYRHPVIFQKYVFKFVFYTVRSALNSVCQWKFYGNELN